MPMTANDYFKKQYSKDSYQVTPSVGGAARRGVTTEGPRSQQSKGVVL